MFCKKCGSEIAEDSLYCAYCGERVESADVERTGKPGTTAAVRVNRRNDGCVYPGMPRKQCTVCGKELPGSTTNDVCAMCTIRERNAEAERARQAADKNPNRERYATIERPRMSATRSYAEDDSPAKNGRGCLYAVIAVVVVVGLIIGIGVLLAAMNFTSHSVKATREPDPQAVTRATELVSNDEETIPYEVFVDDPNVSSESNPFAVPKPALSAEQVIAEYVEPVTWHVFTSLTESDDELTLWLDLDTLRAEGAIVYIDGKFTLQRADEYFEDSLTIGLLFYSEKDYSLVLFEAEGETLVDNRTKFTTDGRLTDEGAREFGGIEGEFPYGEPLLLLPAD